MMRLSGQFNVAQARKRLGVLFPRQRDGAFGQYFHDAAITPITTHQRDGRLAQPFSEDCLELRYAVSTHHGLDPV